MQFYKQTAKDLEIEKYQILRHISLKTNDVENDFLTKNFYDREDVSILKKQLLKEIETKIRELNKLN